MAPISKKYSRAINKAGYTSSNQSQLWYYLRIIEYIFNHPLIFVTPPIAPIPSADLFIRYFEALAAPPSKENLEHVIYIKKRVNKVLNILTAYVNNIAQGDGNIIRASGMAANKETPNKKSLGPVTNLRQLISPKVEVNHCQLSWHKPAGTKTRKGISYRVQVSPVGHPNIIREVGITTKTFLTFDVGDLNVIGALARVTPVNGAPSHWLNVKGQF